VSPWGDECTVDIHETAGMVLEARSVRKSGQILARHETTVLDLAPPWDEATFAVPRRGDFHREAG
jgi:hypothetical protein